MHWPLYENKYMGQLLIFLHWLKVHLNLHLCRMQFLLKNTNYDKDYYPKTYDYSKQIIMFTCSISEWPPCYTCVTGCERASVDNTRALLRDGRMA